MGAKISSKREDVIAALELVVKEFLQPEFIGRWVSVKERSIGNILKEIGVDVRYSTAIYEELKALGMMEKEGERVSMRYKIITDFIPDSKALAESIYQRHMTNANKAKSAYETRKGDLIPPRPKRTITSDDIERKSVEKRGVIKQKDLSRIPHLGQIVYALVNGYITEARITCVRFDENDKVKVDFSTPIIQESDTAMALDADEKDVAYVCKKDYCLRNISFSVEDLIKKLQQNVKKFDNKRK